MLLATCRGTPLSGSKEGPCRGFFSLHILIFCGKCLELVLRIADFIILVFCYVLHAKKKKLRVKISWNQEGNKEVGVKVNAEERMYVKCRRKYVRAVTSCPCHTVRNSNMKELASKSFDNMSVSQTFGNGSNKPKLKSLRSYNQIEFGDFLLLFGFLVMSRNKDKVTESNFTCFSMCGCETCCHVLRGTRWIVCVQC